MPRKSRTSAAAVAAAAAAAAAAVTDGPGDHPRTRRTRVSLPAATPTPQTPGAPASDDEMPDAPASSQSTPQDPASPAQGSAPPSDPPSVPSTPARARTQPRGRRRPGRPSRNRPLAAVADDDNDDDENANAEDTNVDAGFEAGTPFKRRRGRPPMGGGGGGGGRWGRPRGGPSHISQMPIDKHGNALDVVDDEVVLPEDAEGEAKVDRMGRLQGGRQYRCRTFTVLGRGERLYMLSTEPARCMGFRDSYLFFQKHRQLFKIILDDAAKRDLISRQLIPHSYKGRAIGVVTARSVFREFGARIVVGGGRIVDDYDVAEARANGEVEGDLADPLDQLPQPGASYNQNQYVAWHGASSVYHAGPTGAPPPTGRVPEAKRRKVVVTEKNWMLEHARAASRFNATLLEARQATFDGVYDPHSNMMQYPGITQPTHARWEASIPPGPPPSTSARQEPGANRASAPSRNAHGTSTQGVPGAAAAAATPGTGPDAKGLVFSPLPPVVHRRFLIVDTVFQTPPISGLGVPGPDGQPLDVGPPGLDDVGDDIVAELPPECRIAFEAAREQRRRWKNGWQAEMEDGARRRYRLGFPVA